MRIMDVSRILIVFFVFMMTWKETLNQKIHPENNLLERSKRYHENDHDDYLMRVKQVKIEREKKNVPTEEVNLNASLPARGRPLNLSLENKFPAKTYIPTRKFVKIKPLHRNTKNIATTHKPYISTVENNDLSNKKDEQNKANETLTNETEVKVEEKEQVSNDIVDTKTIEEKLPTNIEKDLNKNPEKPIEEPVSIKYEEPQVTKPKTKSMSTKKEFKLRKLYDEESDGDINIKTSGIKQESEKQLKIEKPINTPITELGTSLGQKQDEINNEVEKLIDEKETVSVIQKDSLEKNIEDIVKPSLNGEIIPRKHPFLEAIQNELHISCPINSKPSNDEGNEPKNDNIVEATKKSAFDLNSIHTLPQKTENNDENEGVIIKNNNYEEFIEVARTPNDPTSNLKTAPNNMAPASYDNYYQVPCNNYQVLQTELDLNNNHNQYEPFASSEKQIDEIDGRTVVSYYNYNKRPTAYGTSNYNGNNNYNTLNNNRNYGYVPAKPSQSVGNNVWGSNRGFVNQFQNNANADRIWRSWKNTEYYLKSKNALKQLSNENFHNTVNQNNRADKINNIKVKNAMKVNGYYRR